MKKVFVQEDLDNLRKNIETYLDEDDMAFVYKFILDTANGIKRNQLVLFHGHGNNGKTTLLKHISDFLVKYKLSVSNTSLKYLEYLFQNHKKTFENTHPIYNYKTVKKLCIIKDDYENINYKIITELLFDPKVICNFICETNTRLRFKTNILIMPIKFKKNFDKDYLNLEYECRKCLEKRNINDFSLFNKLGTPQICYHCDIVGIAPPSDADVNI
jgi:hypothetical protein